MLNSIQLDPNSLLAFQKSQIYRTYFEERNISLQIQDQQVNFISNENDISCSIKLFRNYKGIIIDFNNLHNQQQQTFEFNDNEKSLIALRQQYFIKFIEPSLNFCFIEKIEYISTQQTQFVLIHMNFETQPIKSIQEQEIIQKDLQEVIKSTLLKQFYFKIKTIQNTSTIKQLFQQLIQLHFKTTLINYQLDSIQIFGNKQEIKNILENINLQNLSSELLDTLHFIVNIDNSNMIKQQFKVKLLGIQVEEIGSNFLKLICKDFSKQNLSQLINILIDENYDDEQSYKCISNNSWVNPSQYQQKEESQYIVKQQEEKNKIKMNKQQPLDTNIINFDLEKYDLSNNCSSEQNKLLQIMSQFTTNKLVVRTPFVSQQYRNYFHSLGITKQVKVYFVTRNNRKYTQFPSNMVFFKNETAAKNKFFSEKFYVLVEMLVYPKAKYRELKENPNQLCFKEPNQVCPHIALYQI